MSDTRTGTAPVNAGPNVRFVELDCGCRWWWFNDTMTRNPKCHLPHATNRGIKDAILKAVEKLVE